MNFASMLLNMPVSSAQAKPMQPRAAKLLAFIGEGHKSTNEIIEGLKWTQAAVAGAIHSALKHNAIKEVGSWPTGRFGNRVKVWKANKEEV